MSEPQDFVQLDAARRAWLQGLAGEFARSPNVETALALARGAWQCGEYDMALERFQWAHAADPGRPDTTLALVRAACAMARFDIEAATLAIADARNVNTTDLTLHRALKCVPRSFDRARELLAGHPADPACVEFAAALSAIASGDASRFAGRTEPRARARAASLQWAMRHATSLDAHAGLPVDVLVTALDAAAIDGLMLECGVYFGRSLRIIAARGNGEVHGFDSFQGLPEAWSAAEAVGSYSTAGRLPAVPQGVSLHAGWFEDTLPAFFASHPQPVRLLHIDCDLYSSTRTVLAAARPNLVAGSILVFDDMLGYPGYEAHELKAWNEFTALHGVRWELLSASLLGREVAIRIVSI